MAEPSRTVRVSGLPTDIEDDRLKDKLFIHFLRERNGGGEINSVTIVKATPVSALITFEDSGVAQRVIQHSRHILEVDGKKHRVVVTEHRECLDPDKVIVRLSATVDHSQLPGGIMTLKSLHKSHPDIQINHDATVELCTLQGAYSKVQAALAELFDRPGSSKSAENKDSGQPATSGSRSVQTTQKPQTQDSQDQSRKPNKQREQREKAPPGRPSNEYSFSSYRDMSPGSNGWEDTGQTDGAALQLPEPPTTSEEDFSLIVDADMFQYLQKHCCKEYQHILSQYGVSVVDMTNQGLTTLFLQVATGFGEGWRDEERLKSARKAISGLYQENEAKICRDQLPKRNLSLRGGLQKTMENLSVRFPKLLLIEDDQNIYVIGSRSDVSEAKHLLLLDHSLLRGKQEDVTSLLRYPTYDSGSSTDEQRVSFARPSDPLDDGIDQLEDERRAEGARRFKLAAQFNDSGQAALGSRPTEFTVRRHSSPSRQTHLDVLSGTAGITGERITSALSQNTRRDILLKSGDVWPSTASKTTPNSHFVDTRPKSSTSSFSTTQSSWSGSTLLPPAGSGSTLMRASSFSGMPQQKVSQKSEDDSDEPTVRTSLRSSSFSNQTGREKREVYTAEITVSIVMWKHIKEAYSTRVDDLTSDIQMKERFLESSGNLTITLIGANSSKVSSSRLGLEKLVDSVGVDFSVHELRLSELGITDKDDETLRACCTEVRSRFKKVTMQFFGKGLYLLGPKALCSQVATSLREVFSEELAPEHQDFSGPSTSSCNPSTFLAMNESQSLPLLKPESQTSKADSTGSGEERRTNQRSDFHEIEFVNGSISQLLVRKDPVIKEKVKLVGMEKMDGPNSETLVNHSKAGNETSTRHENEVESTTAPMPTTPKDLHKKEKTVQSTQKDSTQQRPTEIRNTTEESRSGPGCICVCGQREMLIKTKCGAAMCSKCLDTLHFHCRVCHETEPPTPGIQGEMTISKLPITIPGHNKNFAIKITYCIPDGIQGEGDPSPGQPFRGGQFETFFPDSKKTWKLVPRLQEAFRQGLTFTVTGRDTEARVSWGCIPHKTSVHRGKPSGYPDSNYLTRLSEVLTSKGIEEPPAKSTK